MSRTHLLAVMAGSMAGSMAALVPFAARAQKDVASCKPVLDATMKQTTVPYHMYGTTSNPVPGGKPIAMELVSAGGQNYVLADGHWTRSPMTAAAMAQQEQENIHNATAMTCQRVRDESVGGTPAIVYSEHSEGEFGKSDGQVWVAKGTGLVLRTENDMDTGDASKTHPSVRYDYSNVQAPADVR
jgi:hypothetical protein